MSELYDDLYLEPEPAAAPESGPAAPPVVDAPPAGDPALVAELSAIAREVLGDSRTTWT